ncbi:MAG: hypothetical protein WDO24_11440 [Pseudomonadota bacterium]
MLVATQASETIALGGGNDTLQLSVSGALASDAIDGGAGHGRAAADRRRNLRHVDDHVAVANVETLRLSSASAAFVLTVSGAAGSFQNIDGSGASGNDTITLNYLETGGTIDLGSGTDTLILFNGTNSVNVMNVDSILGGTGNDTVTLLATPAAQRSTSAPGRTRWSCRPLAAA